MDPCSVYATGRLLALMTNSSNLSLFSIFRINRLRAAKRFWQMESGSSYNIVIVRAKEKVKCCRYERNIEIHVYVLLLL